MDSELDFMAALFYLLAGEGSDADAPARARFIHFAS
jgi:hypothetical protein